MKTSRQRLGGTSVPLTPLVNESDSSEKSLRRTAQLSSNVTYNRIPATNPDITRVLWAEVKGIQEWKMPAGRNARARRGTTSRGAAGRGGANKDSLSVRTRGGSGKLDTHADDLSQAPPTNASASDAWELQTTAVSTVTTTGRTITPRNPKFTSLVLHPRRIFINKTNSITPTAFAHFGTTEPEDGSSVNYADLEGLGGANIWIRLDPAPIAAIASEYKAMKILGLCEEEFATFAKETFFKGERRSVDVSEDRQWRAERMLQLVCPPDENTHWCIPPIFTDSDSVSEVDWTWDFAPGLQLLAFLEGVQSEIPLPDQELYICKELDYLSLLHHRIQTR